MLEKGLLFFQ